MLGTRRGKTGVIASSDMGVSQNRNLLTDEFARPYKLRKDGEAVPTFPNRKLLQAASVVNENPTDPVSREVEAKKIPRSQVEDPFSDIRGSGDDILVGSKAGATWS
eukprot:TRINITY_DN7510_c0_g1_i5.p3 TRINITY_DN7510_c0_g1~~TRINITY_DN7510_c0_g1_i5.p3  ORF type:complete len:106 (-),score=17.08 TRINITY_DN7510_c0_g1_i5:367-684(-)